MGRMYVLCALCLITLLGACINISSIPEVKLSTSAIPLIEFSISPPEIGAGSPTTLQWNVTGANSVTIDGGIGDVGNSGIKTVKPKADATYTLTAVNSAGKSTKSVTVTVKPVPMSLSTSKLPVKIPSITARPQGPLVTRIPSKATYKTYAETLFDLVKQAPTAAWTVNFKSGEPGLGQDIPFPCSGNPVFKYWDNIYLEGGNTYKESVYVELESLPKTKGNVNDGYFSTLLTGDYQVNIPPNSWFTAKIGLPSMIHPPDNKPFIRFWVNYTPLAAAPENYSYPLFEALDVSYDNYVDQVDIDLSHVYGENLCGTSGYLTLILTTEPDPSISLPVVITEAKIAR
ncbi:MAG: hypothetical protein PHO26_02680 [Dehalococcoidia bacterium]|nr:hypothetical protein [Dehalococcoidia bacterium]MDD5493811.1 hypothetical protein [Dehalococcoidia bacterium]